MTSVNDQKILSVACVKAERAARPPSWQQRLVFHWNSASRNVSVMRKEGVDLWKNGFPVDFTIQTYWGCFPFPLSYPEVAKTRSEQGKKDSLPLVAQLREEPEDNRPGRWHGFPGRPLARCHRSAQPHGSIWSSQHVCGRADTWWTPSLSPEAERSLLINSYEWKCMHLSEARQITHSHQTLPTGTLILYLFARHMYRVRSSALKKISGSQLLWLHLFIAGLQGLNGTAMK